MRDVLLEELTRLSETDKNLTLITGDLGFGVVEGYQEKFPKQFLNVGVAEQNMSMIAAGMAMEGKKILTYSIGNFPTLRCLEQIRNDICYHDLDVTIVSVGGGFSYGQLGMSHFATEDISIMRSLPNMIVSVPGTLAEAKGAVRELYKIKSPKYLRLDKSNAQPENESPFYLGKASILKEGDQVTLISCGGILEEVLEAASILESENISCKIISMHTIKPIDVEAIELAVKSTKGIVTVEEHNIIGGLGSAVAEVCLDLNLMPKFFKRIGLNDLYPSIVGDQKFLRKTYKMSREHIVEIVRDLVSKRS